MNCLELTGMSTAPIGTSMRLRTTVQHFGFWSRIENTRSRVVGELRVYSRFSSKFKLITWQFIQSFKTESNKFLY